MKYIDRIKANADKGDIKAAEKYKKIMKCMESMDDDRVANCIILMKELIPELENQSALLIKKYVIDLDRSLRYLSKDETELIEFLRDHLKDTNFFEDVQ
ncbi:MAG: hypothetical protein K0S75_1743 [Clostridia bacterium]|jgi:hypothetical protein|nr:hypothetical protein [Clostridia bacterium]